MRVKAMNPNGDPGEEDFMSYRTAGQNQCAILSYFYAYVGTGATDPGVTFKFTAELNFLRSTNLWPSITASRDAARSVAHTGTATPESSTTMCSPVERDQVCIETPSETGIIGTDESESVPHTENASSAVKVRLQSRGSIIASKQVKYLSSGSYSIEKMCHVS